MAGAVFQGRAQGAVPRMFPSPCWPQAIGNPGSLDKEGRSILLTLIQNTDEVPP